MEELCFSSVQAFHFLVFCFYQSGVECNGVESNPGGTSLLMSVAIVGWNDFFLTDFSFSTLYLCHSSVQHKAWSHTDHCTIAAWLSFFTVKSLELEFRG